MATVEQRDTQSSGLAALSNSLDLFNDFKDDKDSDEESFHLPLLDCDDDLDSNSKEIVTNSTDKDAQCQNGETEDEILNKFETTVTPDIDPKIEDKLLEEIDEICGKKSDEENMDTGNLDNTVSQDSHNIEEEKPSEKDNDASGELIIENEDEKQSDKQADVDSTLPETDCLVDAEEDKVDKEEKEDNIGKEEKEDKIDKETDGKIDKQEKENEIDKQEKEDEIDKQEGNQNEVADEETITNEKISPLEESNNEANQTEDKDDNQELIDDSATVDETTNDDKHTEECSVKPELGNESSTPDIAKDVSEEDILASNLEDNTTDSVEMKELCDDENLPQKDPDEVKEASTKMDVDQSETNQLKPETNTESTAEETKDILEEPDDKCNEKCDSEPQSMDVDISEGDKNVIENNELLEVDENKKEENKTSVEHITDELVEDSPQCKETGNDKKELDENNSDLSSNKKELDKPEISKTLDQPVEQKPTTHSKSENAASDGCENSNDSNKNLDCDDDLLDISIIRDADEDNASAIAENAIDNHASEKSDNDDQDEGSEKAENELEDIEMDQDESSLTTDKDDRMDFDDGNSNNLAYQESTTSGGISDSEAKDDDVRDSESDSNNSSVLKEKTNRISDNMLNSEKNQTELRTELKDAGSQSVGVDDQDSLKENSVKIGGKRSLSEPEITDGANKKIKLSESVVPNEKKKAKKVKTLVTFEKFMQNKKIEKKLTRSDLEQFCLQKICEAIVHKTDVGELHQTIKKQEQIIENLRKDLQQLTKQTRDLDIVNKKLMNELRAQNGIKKPLVPLKITRSVGLQVKLNLGADNNTRRKTPVAINRTPNSTNNTPRQRTIAPTNTRVVRQIASSPRKTPTSTPTPLLSQALQTNRQATPTNNTTTPTRPQIRQAKPQAEPQKPGNPGVIDLTDEDDKASKTATGTPIKIVNKTIPLTQAKNVNIIQGKTVPTKIINTTNQNKTVAIGQVKTATVGSKVTTPTRTVTTLPQGVRLTPTQVKNGSITIPASVVTSSAGTTQLMYVVQPTSSLGQVVTSTAGGGQKAVLLNFQSPSGVLTSALNGSAVSVIPTKTTNTVQLKTVAPRKHPAPLPLPPPVAANASLKPLLPKPHLSIRKTDTGIILQWRMPYNLDIYEGIASYQLFAYQETNAAPSTDMWRKVGDVKALALPMACTLTQFADKNKYYFAVRSVDVHKRIGAFSDPEEISL